MIILGVKENKDGSWRTTGLQNISSLRKQFWDTINNKNKVSAKILKEKDIAFYTVNDDVIMVINVPPAKREEKPIYINNDLFGGTFKRDGEGDYHCTALQVKAMLRDATEETYDMRILPDASLKDLNYITLHGYRNRHKYLHTGHPFESYDDDEYLRAIGAAAISEDDGKLYPTAAGMLMFGNEFNIVRHFPEYFLDYREIMDPVVRWTDRIQSSSGEWSGNICDFYFLVYNKIQKDIKIPFAMVGGNRVDDTPVHAAIREALANCLINADYYGKYGVLIKKEFDVLTLENPGSIRVGRKQMLRGGISDPRNKALMKMFNMINIGERAGSGFPNILMTWKQEHWVMPEVEEQFHPDRTILKLTFSTAQQYSESFNRFDDSTTQTPDSTTQTPDSTTQAPDSTTQTPDSTTQTPAPTTQTPDFTTQITQLSGSDNWKLTNVYSMLDIELMILNMMKKNPEYSQSKIAEELKTDPNRVKYYVRKLRQLGIIHRVGSSHKGRWVVDHQI